MAIINRYNSIKKFLPIYVLMLPGLILLFIFAYIPMIGLLMAFKDYKIMSGFWGIITSPNIGLSNFQKFFSSIYFGRILSNTLLLSLYSFIFGWWVPIVLAILFNELRSLYFKKFVQTVSYLPYFLSTVIVVGILNAMVSPTYGLINGLLTKLGYDAIFFLGDPKYFRGIYTFLGIWKGAGWGTIVYLAGITTIDIEQYESAIIDGASRFRRIWHITIPGISNLIILLLILRAGSVLSVDFETIFLIYSPAIYDTADVISTYVYREGVINGSFSYASAVGLFNSIIGMILIYMSNKIANKTGNQGIW